MEILMKKVLLLRGLPASGKSSWAKEVLRDNPGAYKRISKDDLRAMFDNGKWSGANEKFVLKVRDLLILKSLEAGKHVIVDDTNLHPKHEAHIRELVKLHPDSVEVVVKLFEVDIEECIARDLRRPNPVGERVIRDMYRQFLQPNSPSIPKNPELSDVIICDLDGTLADPSHRDPYDASTCEQDRLHDTIAHLLKIYSTVKVEIIIVSGRQDTWRVQTDRWLEQHQIPYIELHMRREGDTRKDSIVKKEIYETSIKGRWNVLFVLDDRESVVAFWRSQGLVCFQVAEGHF